MTETETEVLVVGAGPVGLSLAIELGRRGIRTLVIEKAPRVGRSPRAKTTNVRSMEHMRRWGLAEAIRQAAPLPAGHANRVVFATGMAGHLITAFDNVNFTDLRRDDRFSEPGQWIPQYAVEEVLLTAARALPAVTVRTGVALAALDEDAEGALASVAAAPGMAEAQRAAEAGDAVGAGKAVAAGAKTAASAPADGAARTGPGAMEGRPGTRRIRARYVVGADGARSTVRGLLGIAMEGSGSVGTFVTYILRMPGFGASPALGDALMYWLINPASPGIIGPMDCDDTWFWGAQVPPGAVPGPAEMRGRIAASIGRAAPFEILSHDVWEARRLIAASYGGGRVFLAGDACHLHPPFGGYGMNLGIGDAVDLGWKLAAVLRGWGGPRLLESYEAERRPLHRRVVDEAVENMAQLAQHFGHPDLAADGPAGESARAAAATAIREGKAREFSSLGLVKGYDYDGSPLVVPDGSALPDRSVMDYRPTARPGHVAPHGWLADGASVYDRFGPDLTLVDFGPPAPEDGRVEGPRDGPGDGPRGGPGDGPGKDTVAAFERAAEARGVPLAVLRLEDPALARLYGARFVLIRPDQHVAWRGDNAPGAPGAADGAGTSGGPDGAGSPGGPDGAISSGGPDVAGSPAGPDGAGLPAGRDGAPAPGAPDGAGAILDIARGAS